MLNLIKLSETVQRNCHISDAFHAGNYSMCTFLLKMREYYRWEQKIPLSQPLPKDKLGTWLVDRESSWEEITSQNPNEEYLPLEINNAELDPFDSTKINEQLQKDGLVYSSGFGLFNKPHFFLGQLKNKEIIDQHTLTISAREYARDLTAPPAMLQGKNIYIRQESVRRFIWEKIEEWQWKKISGIPMAHVIKLYGETENIETLLDLMVEQETNAMFYHEIGEIKAGKLLGKQWQEMLISIAQSKAEILSRAVRDLLADCIHTLPTLLTQNHAASLHFYFANFSGVRKTLFPEAYEAYNSWVESGNTDALYDICKTGKKRWHKKAQEILMLYNLQRDRLEKQIESLF